MHHPIFDSQFSTQPALLVITNPAITINATIAIFDAIFFLELNEIVYCIKKQHI